MSDTPPPRLPGAFYRLLGASATTNLADGLLSVALPWLASAITRDPLLIAIAAFGGRLPWLLFTLPAGIIADRVDRRRLVVGSDLARALILLAFGATVLLTTGPDGQAAQPLLLLGLLYATTLLTGFAEVLRDNTAQTFMPSLVARSQLHTANGRLWAVEMTTNQFIGPPLAGFFLGMAAGLPFLTSAGLYALGAALVLAIRGGFAPRTPTGAGGPAPWRAQLAEGWRGLWHSELLRTLALALGALNGAAALGGAIFVLFAQEVIGVGAQGFGLLLTGMAAGSVTGSLLAARAVRLLPQSSWLVIAILVIAAGHAVTGLAATALVVWCASFVSGALIMIWNVITVSLRQTLVPDHMLGRVNSVYRFFGWGTMSIGTLLGGLMVTLAEPLVGREWALRMPFLLAAALSLAVLVYAAPRLTVAKLEAARRAAEEQEGGSGGR